MIKMFDGQNYQVWAIHMKDVLRERRLLKYIEATMHDYEEDEDIQALTEIRFTLSDNQIRLIIHCESTHDTWEKLRNTHQHSSMSNRMFLMNQFLGLTMKETERMQEFVRCIDDLADQISSLSEEQVKDEQKALILTRGIPEHYSMVVIALQEMNKISNYDHVVTSLMNEETRHNERNGQSSSNEKAFYSNQQGNRGRGQACGQGNQGHRGRNPKFNGNCRFCGIYGHKENECRKKQGNHQGNRQDNPQGNFYRGFPRGSGQHQGYRSKYHCYRGNYRGNYGQDNQANYTEQNPQGDYAFNITASMTTTSNQNEWVMDSGASQHMAFDRGSFTNYEAFKDPIPI